MMRHSEATVLINISQLHKLLEPLDLENWDCALVIDHWSSNQRLQFMGFPMSLVTITAEVNISLANLLC